MRNRTKAAKAVDGTAFANLVTGPSPLAYRSILRLVSRKAPGALRRYVTPTPITASTRLHSFTCSNIIWMP